MVIKIRKQEDVRQLLRQADTALVTVASLQQEVAAPAFKFMSIRVYKEKVHMIQHALGLMWIFLCVPVSQLLWTCHISVISVPSSPSY